MWVFFVHNAIHQQQQNPASVSAVVVSAFPGLQVFFAEIALPSPDSSIFVVVLQNPHDDVHFEVSPQRNPHHRNRYVTLLMFVLFAALFLLRSALCSAIRSALCSQLCTLLSDPLCSVLSSAQLCSSALLKALRFAQQLSENRTSNRATAFNIE